MKILLINGSPNKDGATAGALKIATRELLFHSVSPIWYNIGDEARRCCISCGGCKERGKCVFSDIDTLTEMADEADGFIIGTPTHYAAPSGALLSVLSRLGISAKARLKGKPALTVATGRRAGALSSISVIDGFYKFVSMPICTGNYPAVMYGRWDKEGEGAIAGAVFNLIKMAEQIKNYGAGTAKTQKTDIGTLSEKLMNPSEQHDF